MKYHEAASIFPLDEEHVGELAEDIREHGLQVPIEICDKSIIDGRRRWLACEQIDMEPEVVEVARLRRPRRQRKNQAKNKSAGTALDTRGGNADTMGDETASADWKEAMLQKGHNHRQPCASGDTARVPFQVPHQRLPAAVAFLLRDGFAWREGELL